MSQLRPFFALRPFAPYAQEVVAPPYDILSPEDTQRVARENPNSFLNVSRSDIFSDFDHSRENFHRIIKNCSFFQETTPSLYIYRLKTQHHTQTGIIGTFSIEDYDRGLIKKHENVRSSIVEDRSRHLLSIQAQIGPIFLFYPDVTAINSLIYSDQNQTPIYDFYSSDQTRHTVWKVSDPKRMSSLFESKVPNLYIADGHHRLAASSLVRKTILNNKQNQSQESQYFLAAAFASSEIQVLPYHRIIKDLNQMDPNHFFESLKEFFEIRPGDINPVSSHQFGMYLNRAWYQLRPLTLGATPQLDVNYLQDTVLSKILGIHDPSTTERIEFIGGTPDIPALESKVNLLKAGVAFTVASIPVEKIIEIADRGEVLPPKSTWFEPKLPDGLICHPFRS